MKFFFNSFGLQCYLIDGEHEFSEETSVEGVDGRLDHFDQILGGAEIVQTKKLDYLGPMTDWKKIRNKPSYLLTDRIRMTDDSNDSYFFKSHNNRDL